MITVCLALLVVGCTTRNDQIVNVSTSSSSSSSELSTQHEQLIEDQLHVDPIEVEGRFWTTSSNTDWGSMIRMTNPVLLAVPRSLFSDSIQVELEPYPFVHVFVEDRNAKFPRGKSGFATFVVDPQQLVYFGPGEAQIEANLESVKSIRTDTSLLQGNLEQMGFPTLSTGDTYKGFMVSSTSENTIVFSKPVHISAPFSPQLHGGYFVELSRQQASESLPLPESLISSRDPYFYITNTITELSYNPDPDVAERGTITGVFDNFTVTFYGTFVTVGAEAVKIEQLQY